MRKRAMRGNVNSRSGPHNRRTGDLEAPHGAADVHTQHGRRSAGSNANSSRNDGKRGGRAGRLRRLVDILAGRHMRPGQRRLVGALASLILLAILLCMLVLLQAFANFDDFFGPGAERLVGEHTAAPVGTRRPATNAADKLYKEDEDNQRRWLGGVPPDVGAQHHGRVGRPNPHNDDRGIAAAEEEVAVPAPSYLDLRYRSHPYLTVRQLESMAEGESVALELGTPITSEASPFVFSRSQLTLADRSLEDALHYLYPPQQRAAQMREELDAFLSIGPRPVREPAFDSNRQAAMRFLVEAGLGTRRFTPASGGDGAAAAGSAAFYTDAPHLSEKGKDLLLARVHTSATALDMRRSAVVNLRGGDVHRQPDSAAGAGVEHGWWWTLAWDNFSAPAPVTAANNRTPAVFHNMVFHFAGGSRFRTKAARAAAAAAAEEEKEEGTAQRARARRLEARGFVRGSHAAYEQESLIKLAGDAQPNARAGGHAQVSRPFLETLGDGPNAPPPSPPATTTFANGKTHGGREVVLTRSGRRVPLKASFAASRAAPVTHQPLTHVAFAAHWDTIPETAVKRHPQMQPPLTAKGTQARKRHPQQPFLGACDSAVPMMLLQRKMKNIAVLSDVAEAVAALYLAEYQQKQQNEGAGREAEVPAAANIPGVTTRFKDASADDVARHLRQVISPAHYALLYKYFFPSPSLEQKRRSDGGGGGDDGPRLTDARRRNLVPPSVFSLFHGVQPDARDSSVGDNTSFPVDEDRTIDPRTLLDWVQHLPSITVFFFDGEEALESWQGDDNTYGSRHLAQQWAATPASAITPPPFASSPHLRARAGEERQRAATLHGRRELMLMEDMDLFVLYDLLGPPSTALQNFFPSQSGLFYAELARIEKLKRKRALAHGSRLTKYLVDAALAAVKATPSLATRTDKPQRSLLTRILLGDGTGAKGHDEGIEQVRQRIVQHDGEALGAFAYLARYVHLDSLQSVLGPFTTATTPQDAHTDNLNIELITDIEKADRDFGSERGQLWSHHLPNPQDGDGDTTTTATNIPQTTPVLFKHEFYHAMPPVWRAYGSPHEMFTLHAIARDGSGDNVRALGANPQLRLYELIRHQVYKLPTNARKKAEVELEKLRNGTYEGVVATPTDGDIARREAAARYFTVLSHMNSNVFFSLAQAPLPTRYSFTFAVDDDHKHWLDSQRVLHLISLPFPPAWHTPFDNEESIDEGTMTDLWTVLWDFTLLLGEYWESQ